MSTKDTRQVINEIVKLEEKSKECAVKRFYELISEFEDRLIGCLKTELINRYKIGVNYEQAEGLLMGRLITHFRKPPEDEESEGFKWEKLTRFEGPGSSLPSWICTAIKRDIARNIQEEIEGYNYRDSRRPVSYDENKMIDSDNTVGSLDVIERADKEYMVGETAPPDNKVEYEYEKIKDIERKSDIVDCIEKVKEKASVPERGERFERWIMECRLSTSSVGKVADEYNVTRKTIYNDRDALLPYFVKCMNEKGYNISKDDFINS
jgi:hypothetical protein